jgi:hypothetical protein
MAALSPISVLKSKEFLRDRRAFLERLKRRWCAGALVRAT